MSRESKDNGSQEKRAGSQKLFYKISCNGKFSHFKNLGYDVTFRHNRDHVNKINNYHAVSRVIVNTFRNKSRLDTSPSIQYLGSLCSAAQGDM